MEHKQPTFIPTTDAIEIDYESLPDDASLAAHLVAGAFAGIMEHTVMFPIDSLKTRMQMSSGPSNSTSLISKSIIQSINKISSAEGAYSLWRGVSSVVLGAGPAHAVYFSVFEASKTLLVNRFTNSKNSNKIVTDENHPLIASGAGIAATTASDALMTPFDMLKQRMQASTSIAASAAAQRSVTSSINNAGAAATSVASHPPPPVGAHAPANSVKLFRLAGEIYKKEGFSAFYISYPTTLFTNIPFAALNFGFYEYSSSVLNPTNAYNPYLHCVSGGIAGGIAAALTNPLDCIKTALQTRGISTNVNMRTVTGFTSAASALFKEGGIRAFTRGLKPRIIFNVPSTAISWTAYEMAKELLLK
ncbi:mitochondrial thiamine pyrophosphate carrier 1 [[Candida] railenensis]|uniref:Mitochondrial thiamine pyrophosphate carrier 1 n=1 Tax=[Candida] railenensis TaxID=45579 RepID=A0A9P0VW25_9ASCO|nr:mitochondrial thiamine pyrophosphate carrier 1 [[Candida] railenensis]